MLKSSNAVWSDAWGTMPDAPAYVDATTGIGYDFNYGLRIRTPDGGSKTYQLKVENGFGNEICNTVLPEKSQWIMPYKYFIDCKFTVKVGNNLFTHRLNLKDQLVAIKLPMRTLGDPIAFFSYVPYFQQKHKCKVVVFCSQMIKDIFDGQYADIVFDTIDNEAKYHPYATYYLGLFYDEEYSEGWQPYDFRNHGLHTQAAHILGVNPFLEPEPPKVNVLNPKRDIKEPYVAISYSGSKANKLWQNPEGWRGVIKYLKNVLGYRVICIDKEPWMGVAPNIAYIPHGCEDFTGAFPITQRINLLKHADMFIGMASGLSWVAWCCRIPVVMISGFSLPYAEFDTPYRVINTMAGCIGCWNDNRINFCRHNYMWCPRIEDTLAKLQQQKRDAETPAEAKEIDFEIAETEAKRFICTQTITPEMVIAKIDQVIADRKKV